ncbi:DUF6436 domain-containing protein [Alteromonas sp. a30]|uniref:DUF6436 domain-containing protein n=1 Tax=Alteromonas sp. a30 TaxID=2730917 RepID=UPI002280529F|nr:DUF6436 domain-containing protein [Alteromonas sp. a30]MCY7297089.1 hypothetical protein [Alteromonas sp. a30]
MSKISPFDPHSELASNMADMTFDNRLRDTLIRHGIDVHNTVVHFTQAHCVCAQIAQRHINSVKQRASAQSYNNVQVSLNQLLALKAFIPSIPAVAVFNKNAQLSYLGPYSTGLYCSPNEGIVEKFIPSQDHLIGANIMHEAQGCYCQV